MNLTKSIVLSIILLAVTSLTYAQNNALVKGTVFDESGMPLPGVSILLKNTQTGTSTDFDGRFELNAPSDGVLVLSYLGYQTTEIPINSQKELNVTLQPDLESLEEVVVVGYGIQKKSVVTGAISSIKQSDLEDLPITRVEQSLQGRASGLTIAANAGQPGSSSTIRVRGITTLNNNEPLWVVDGIIVDAGGIGYLNQSDIASIEVLKDAASAAIYGSRAATGVILVTTKKGKSGKLSINYNGYVGSSGPARKLDLLNATEYATLRNEASVAGGGGILFTDPESFGEGTDWQSAIFSNNAMRIGQEVSLSGGNDKSTFYTSFGYLKQDGIVLPEISNYTRKNIRLNSTHKVKEWLRFGQTIGYSNEKNVGIGNTNSEYGGPLSSAINLDPITPVVVTDPDQANQSPYVDADGNPTVGVFRDSNGNPYGISSYVGQEMTNPIAYSKTRLGNYGWSDNFVGNAYVEIEPLEGLVFKSTLGGKLAYWGYDSFTPVSYLTSSFVVSQNNISRGRNKGFGWNLENTVSYDKNINDHNFTVLLGQGVYVDNITSGETITKFNIPVDNYRDASFNFDVPTEQITANAYSGVEHRVTSLFARLNYNYKEKYLLTALIRRDGSTRFGSNNKYGSFPSFSVGWVPTQEEFWPEESFVNQLKIRGGYGITGNDQIGDFRYLSTIGDGRNYAIGSSGSVTIGNSPNAPANPDLKWEETSQTNIGFDSRFFNTLSLTFDWYLKKTSGILRSIPIPGYVGATGLPVGNIGDMENTGIEIELGYNETFGDFKLSLNGNFSTLKNTVTYLGENLTYYDSERIQASTYNITRTQVGEPVNSFYGFVTNGIFQNQDDINNYTNSNGTVIQPNARPGDFKWKDLNGDGAITDQDRDFLGNSLPKISYGFTINMAYKNFDLLIFAQGAAGNKIFQGLRRLDIGSANFQTTALNRWTGEGSSNSFPRLTTNDTNKNFTNPSDFYLEDGDYLRFKTVQLGYSLPKDFFNSIGIDNIRLYVTGENLLTFTKYTGFDPEIGGGVFGVDRGYYPQPVTGMFGLSVKF